jgi:predicted nucleic acid-binding Zn ribbon protein
MIVDIDSVAAAGMWLRTNIRPDETIIFEVADDVDINKVPTTFRRCPRCVHTFVTDRIGEPGTKTCPECGYRTAVLSEADMVVQGNQTYRTNSHGRRSRRLLGRVSIVSLSRLLYTRFMERR